jgi:hypothetical protein
MLIRHYPVLSIMPDEHFHILASTTSPLILSGDEG